MSLEFETVVARATPDGEGGLAVIRISGKQAFAVASRIFRGRGFAPTKPEPRRAVFGTVRWPAAANTGASATSAVIDQAILLPLPEPGSYTGEDTVEIYCHGGRVVAAAVHDACVAAGAVPAPPGEFTRRAFLNGKLTLDQAEAVADLIQAESRHSAQAAVGQLRGGLDAELTAVEQPLLTLLSRIEGTLEFSDDEDLDTDPDEVRRTVGSAVDHIDRLLALAPAGRLLREGVHIVLAGPPNAGKSSLFNLLLDEERALIDAEAGTTRDVVSARLRRDDDLFVLHDTAGLRDDGGRVEKLGMERTWRQVREADIVLLLREAGDPIAAIDVGAAPLIQVITKADLQDDANAEIPAGEAVVTSSLTGRGRAELWAAIDRIVADTGLREAVALGVVLNERHRHRLRESRDELRRLADDLQRGDPGAEVVGTLLSSILAGLGEISGRVFSEQLLADVFRRFCVGK